MQIELYHREQQKVRENQLKDEQKRLQDLKDKLHLQALKDKERLGSVCSSYSSHHGNYL